MNCECGHPKKEHTQKEGCLHQYPPGDPHDFQDVQGYCVCIEYYRIEGDSKK